MVDLVIRLLLAIILVVSLVVLNYVLFKIPIRNNDKQIALISVVVGATNFYFKDVIHTSSFMLIQILVYFVAILVLRRYPFFYALFVSSIGTIAISFVDTLVTLGALNFNISVERMQNELPIFTTLHLIVSATLLILAYVLYKAKIGFSFIVRRFSGTYSLKTGNFIWAILVLISTMVQQLASEKIAVDSFHAVIIITITLIFIALTIHAFLENRKVLKVRNWEDVKSNDKSGEIS